MLEHEWAASLLSHASHESEVSGGSKIDAHHASIRAKQVLVEKQVLPSGSGSGSSSSSGSGSGSSLVVVVVVVVLRVQHISTCPSYSQIQVPICALRHLDNL